MRSCHRVYRFMKCIQFCFRARHNWRTVYFNSVRCINKTYRRCNFFAVHIHHAARNHIFGCAARCHPRIRYKFCDTRFHSVIRLIAIAAANSARKIVFPNDIPIAPAASNAANSSSENPPAGPTKIFFAPRARLAPATALGRFTYSRGNGIITKYKKERKA